MKALCWHGKHDIRYETVPDAAPVWASVALGASITAK